MDKNNKPKKAWYKRVWVWIGIIVLIGIIAGAAGGSEDSTTNTKEESAPTTQSDAPAETEEPAKFDLEAAYAKLETGMTKAQVEEATGKESDNCTESDMGELGKSESCSYGNPFIDKGSIMVIYSNGELSSKTKSTY
ncbi:hypothetical protein RAAC3_TM7C00001G0441 [Candidatus Saccharibacteria bacterium RAAC3_TM7_1]|nr:hypothetical protein RAAC3_TM7C00001G0441 [Candidatus Saccharibacteria bacterium RAAC3_TM7_1]